MTLGDRCDEIVRLIDETLDGMTTPVPPRRRRPASDASGATGARPGRRTVDSSFGHSTDPGSSAA